MVTFVVSQKVGVASNGGEETVVTERVSVMPRRADRSRSVVRIDANEL